MFLFSHVVLNCFLLRFFQQNSFIFQMENSTDTNAEIHSVIRKSKLFKGNATRLRRSSRIRAIRERQILEKQQKNVAGKMKMQLKMKKMNAMNPNKNKLVPAKTTQLPLKGILKVPLPKKLRKKESCKKHVTFA
ncbi:hypothetical protein T11_8949 [Trichinella zimbabwensis]|uniref:Uncharacterized protein n=1 Tax=Trichinella zimbabwensis TaxID=268475 RepID=A0A0V1GX85_9BILA|nr:hypothetical protein T11_8949 [Trichinella zimbabwensis]